MLRQSVMTLVLKALEKHGILLNQDKTLPSVVTLIAGEALTTSWWSHPQGDVIFRCLSELADHPDVLFTKLVAGKVTLVHRRLWPELLAVALAREPWQFQGLVREARELWEEVTRLGSMLASGKHAGELEKRLLVHGDQVHTEAGRHQTQLEAWPKWAERVVFRTDLAAQEGKARLEAVLLSLGGAGGELPWEQKKMKPKKTSKKTP
jgi:hypothetical protein